MTLPTREDGGIDLSALVWTDDHQVVFWWDFAGTPQRL